MVRLCFAITAGPSTLSNPRRNGNIQSSRFTIAVSGAIRFVRRVEIEIVPRIPTIDEFAALKASVGFKPHSPESMAIGLVNSFCAVCACDGDRVVGTGRVVGDGAMNFYITGIMVRPEYQRRGIGTRIVEALIGRIKTIPYENVLVEALPLPGLDGFYARFGFRANRQYAAGMHLWLNSRQS